ncbi:MAG: ATP-binding protein, partial [Azoarcus sp.]|nr:ATP-binding protein [Azoarcus sp.]
THWLKVFDVPEKRSREARQEALQWALMRGSRSGRVAWQFARDFAGRLERGNSDKSSNHNKKSGR